MKKKTKQQTAHQLYANLIGGPNNGEITENPLFANEILFSVRYQGSRVR